MTVTIVGTQLGDEGKGGIVDLFGVDADVVVRYQGGDNAGHTVVVGGEEYKLSLVPSGAVRGLVGVLGNGCVVNPRTLFDEIDDLRDRGLDPDVRVAYRAHAILPYHRVLDGLEEDRKRTANLEAATTGRGIGPAYEDKAGRRGIRVGDLLDPSVLRKRLEYVVPQKRSLAEDVFGIETGDEFDVDGLYEEYRAIGKRFREEGMPVDAGAFLTERIGAGDQVLFEGAQGSALDIDHGIYPFVTSSNTTAGGVCTGTGLAPGLVGSGEIIGVVKAYLSRVGTGPLPTELGGVEGQTPEYEPGAGQDEALASTIREAGGEYGTVTGRPRRVGWLDMPMLRQSTRANGLTGLAINHLDTLANLDEVKVGHTYSLAGEERLTPPPTTELWGDCEPNYRSFAGWPDVDWAEVAETGWDGLPGAARDYLDYIAGQLDVPIYAVGVGPGREETVRLQSPF